MQVGITHPTDRPNFCRVELGPLNIWFSYRTPIAFALPGEGRVVRENDWSTTTGRHLNEIDGGDKFHRIDGATFEARLGAILDRLMLVEVAS